MRIGVAGLGFGVNLLHTLLTRGDCTVAAAADIFPERLEAARAKGIDTYEDAARMVREAGLDAVVIASAPHVRGPALDAAIAAGIPVFMEKPLAATPAEARALIDRIGDHPVMLGFSFRFHAPVQRLLAEMDGLGAPRVLNAEYLFDWLPPGDGWLWDAEKGGGFFTENSCHLFDVVRAVMGDPVQVYAAGIDDGARPSATAAALTLHYPGGAVAALTIGGIGTGAMGDYPRLDLTCSGGRAEMRGRQHMWTALHWARRGGEVTQLAHDPEPLGRTRYSAAFDHFLDRTAAGDPFDATPRDGLAAVELADAIYRSIASGQPEPIGQEQT